MNVFAEMASYGDSFLSGGTVMAMVLFLVIPPIVASWRMFEKAKKPGWASLIPIYNTYTLIQMAGKPEWWILVYWVPFLNLFLHYWVAEGLAKAFGKSYLFGIWWLWVFSPIGYLIVGLGDAKYKKPKAA